MVYIAFYWLVWGSATFLGTLASWGGGAAIYFRPNNRSPMLASHTIQHWKQQPGRGRVYQVLLKLAHIILWHRDYTGYIMPYSLRGRNVLVTGGSRYAGSVLALYASLLRLNYLQRTGGIDMSTICGRGKQCRRQLRFQ